MTLILGLMSDRVTLQVSDRLLSANWKPRDPISNKTILYEAPDAIVSMAYTGAAHLSGIPTDEWIAEVIGGCSMQSGGKSAILLTGRLPQWLHIGPTLNLLQERLRKVFKGPSAAPSLRDPEFEILVVGWQWRRHKRPRAIIAGIHKKRGSCDVSVWRAPRRFAWTGRLYATPGSNLEGSDGKGLGRSLNAARSDDEAESLMASFIGEVSSRLPVVGADCMSVLIPPPRFKTIRVSYIPRKTHTAELRGQDGKYVEPFVPTFSPWVIGPGGMAAPSIMYGGHDVRLGKFAVRIQGPEPAPGAVKGKGPQLISAAGPLPRRRGRR